MDATEGEVTRRACATCGDGTMQLVDATGHAVRVKVMLVPVGDVSQGQSLHFVCEGCGAQMTLLDARRRGWFVYSIVVGVLFAVGGAALALSFPRDGSWAWVVAALGIALALGFGLALGDDAAKRKKHAPR